MSTRYFGEPVKRNEDARLLTGAALFVDDVELTDMVHGAFLRSPYAHAQILSIDSSAAPVSRRASSLRLTGSPK